LTLAHPSAEILSIETGDSFNGDRESCFRWSKPGVPFTHSSSTAWRIALQLLSSSGTDCGTLTVLRLYSERDLQIDINLLTAGFPTVLADALHRTLARPTPFLGLADQSGTLLEAEAG